MRKQTLFTTPSLADIDGDEKAANFICNYIANKIPNSSTKLSLNSTGYPESGPIHQVIEKYRNQDLSPYKKAEKALETGCGNCSEMSYAAAIKLKSMGYSGYLAVGQYGLNHVFTFVGNLIVDTWAGKYYKKAEWKDHICAYGGAIKDGVLKGRLLSPKDPKFEEELEDEEPELLEEINYPSSNNTFSK